MSTEDQQSSPELGLYDGFEGYRTASPADYREVFNTGMVAIDANILLHLYRYTEKARTDLLSVLVALGDLLWVPHQALNEFWRNRDSTLNDPKKNLSNFLDELASSSESATKALRTWANRVNLPEGRRQELTQKIEESFNAVREQVTFETERATTQFSRDTNNDAILAQLAEILQGRVGGPLPAVDLAAALQESARRIQAKEPPGYRDADKGENSAGDYLVWEQLLRESTSRNCDAIFVTSDTKEDWWRLVAGEARGPRLELIREFNERTGHRIFFLRPNQLLSLASDWLSVSVDPTSVDEVERVDRSRADAERDQTDTGAPTPGSIPSEIREELIIAIYQRAHDIGWENLSNAEKTNQYRQWIEDPSIGGILVSFMREENARVWIKDGPMKEYARAQEGFGPYARYAVQRFMGADEVVGSACGAGWTVVPDSLGEKPMHCLATDGLSTRYVCWGRPGSFRDLVWAALNQPSEGLEMPAVVITLREDEDVRRADRAQQEETADRSGLALTYLRRKMFPNPDLGE